MAMKSVKRVSQLNTRAVMCGTDFVAVREKLNTVIAARLEPSWRRDGWLGVERKKISLRRKLHAHYMYRTEDDDITRQVAK